MKRLRDVLIVVVLGTLAIWGVACAFSGAQGDSLGRNVIYGQATRACEEDDRVCSFATVESAAGYLNSSDHKASVAMRELKEQQNAAASKAASAAIENGKHRHTQDRIGKLD
jgi:hypothetical protein